MSFPLNISTHVPNMKQGKMAKFYNTSKQQEGRATELTLG